MRANRPEISCHYFCYVLRECLSPVVYVLDEGFSRLDCCCRAVPADDSLGLTASRESELAVSALGACVWYLKVCLVDHEILSLKRFEVYHPVDAEGAGAHVDTPHYITSRQHMVCVRACVRACVCTYVCMYNVRYNSSNNVSL